MAARRACTALAASNSAVASTVAVCVERSAVAYSTPGRASRVSRTLIVQVKPQVICTLNVVVKVSGQSAGSSSSMFSATLPGASGMTVSGTVGSSDTATSGTETSFLRVGVVLTSVATSPQPISRHAVSYTHLTLPTKA